MNRRAKIAQQVRYELRYKSQVIPIAATGTMRSIIEQEMLDTKFEIIIQLRQEFNDGLK